MHSWLFGCLVRLGQDTNVGNFALVYFEKKATFENFVGVGAEDTICTICGQKWQNVHLHPFRFVGPNLHKIVFFVGGWVGGLVFFLGGVPHLALSPPCFCWFVLGFIGVLFALPFVLRLKFSVSLSFYLACLSVSLSLSISLSPFCFSFSLSLSLLIYFFFLVLFHYYFLVFFFVLLSCFFFGGGGRFVCFCYMK